MRASVPVTPGETLTIKVGGGGARGTTTRQAANGGGRSEILRGSTPLVIAGAGGGAGGYGNGWVSSFGGLGGGLTGGAAEAGASSANPAATPGQGGTQSAGGAVGSPTGSFGTPATAGASRQGGSGNYTGSLKTAAWTNGGRSSATEEERGGGGGDGYFGGGAGGGQGTWGNGGGGGSSYTDAACTGVMHAQGTNVSGTGPTAPGVTEDGYIAGVALGGLNSASGGVDGGPGLVVITPN